MSEQGVAAQLRKIFEDETERAPYSFLVDIDEIEERVLAVLANHVCVDNSPELLEKLAELEHEQWSHWIQHQHKLRKGMVNYVYAQKWKDWLKLSRTPYSELTEEQKESDRQFAKEVLKVLGGGVEAT